MSSFLSLKFIIVTLKSSGRCARVSDDSMIFFIDNSTFFSNLAKFSFFIHKIALKNQQWFFFTFLFCYFILHFFPIFFSTVRLTKIEELFHFASQRVEIPIDSDYVFNHMNANIMSHSTHNTAIERERGGRVSTTRLRRKGWKIENLVPSLFTLWKPIIQCFAKYAVASAN